MKIQHKMKQVYQLIPIPKRRENVWTVKLLISREVKSQIEYKFSKWLDSSNLWESEHFITSSDRVYKSTEPLGSLKV
jgi:hypothetical protein